MLIVRGISGSVTPYYLDGRDPGCWTPAAGRLLGLEGPVLSGDLAAVLRGRHPTTGDHLPRFRASRRRAGWDLVFSAPKSVSLLARGDPSAGESVADAHVAAVGHVLGYLEDRLTISSRAPSGGFERAGGLVGARFEHRSNAAGEPHVHTHVLVANLTLTAKGWRAVRSGDWFIDRRCLDALYQLSLRSELATRGWEPEWRLHPDGRGDVAAVPSAAVRAASAQGRLVASVGPFRARQQATAQPWRERVGEAGWTPARPLGVESNGPGPGSAGMPDGADLAIRVTNQLAGRRSDFRVADVVVALAASHPAGATPEQAVAWADRFCAASLPVRSPTLQPRWTTRLARAADDRLVDVLEDLQARSSRAVVAGLEHPVTVLASPAGRTSLIGQCEMLDRLRREWERSGMSACVASPGELAAARWRVLTGLPPYRPGSGADVIVVDQADRRSTAELLHLAAAAGRRSAHLVLVEGGTMPRLSNVASHGLARFAAGAGRVNCPPPQVWQPDGRMMLERGAAVYGREAAGALLARWAERGQEDLLVGLGLEEVRSLNAAARSMSVEMAGSTVSAGGVLRGDAGGAVGRAAGRAVGGAAGGPAGGPAGGAAGGARRGFSAGDRVVVIRAGQGRPAYGTFGDLLEVSGRYDRVAIRWAGSNRIQTYGRQVLAGLGHGWAVTAHLAGRVGRPIMLLGPAEAAPRLRPLVRASIEPVEHDHGRRLGISR